MAGLNSVSIFLDLEPIVKLFCKATDCKNNLMNCYSLTDGQQAACNLKQITIGKGGQCQNYLPFEDKK